MTAFFSSTCVNFAAELGDPAAPLQIAEWVKGKPVDLEATKGKKIVVVEFWATWCGPCRASIPHLTEMAKQFEKKDVLFVGVSDETLSKVKPFVEKMGDKMDYNVAIDRDKKTGAGYMSAYDIHGIPHAFVVNKENRVVWQGHPMAGLDKALERIVANTYDLATEKKRGAAQQKLQKYFEMAGRDPDDAALEPLGKELTALDQELDGIYAGDKLDLTDMRKRARFQTLLSQYQRALSAGKSDSELAALEEKAAAVSPKGFNFAEMKSTYQLNSLFSKYYREAKLGNSTEMAELGKKLGNIDAKNGEALNNIAWTILTDEEIKHRDLKLALKLATMANEASGDKEAHILDTLARALFDNGRKTEAVKVEQRAIELCKDPEQKEQFESALGKFKGKD